MDAETQAVLVDFERLGARDRGLAEESVASVTEHESPIFDSAIALTFLRQLVLDLEQIGEVRIRGNAHVEVLWFCAVVQEREVLVKALADFAFAADGDVGIDVNGSR